MSILIKDMKLPTNCEECPCSYWTEGVHHDYCQAVGYDTEINYGEKGRPTWCPLIELPPHGRLIDAEEISKHKYTTIPPYRKEYSDGKPKSDDEIIAFKFGWNDAIAAIVENAPTVIEAEGGGI